MSLPGIFPEGDFPTLDASARNRSQNLPAGLLVFERKERDVFLVACSLGSAPCRSSSDSPAGCLGYVCALRSPSSSGQCQPYLQSHPAHTVLKQALLPAVPALQFNRSVDLAIGKLLIISHRAIGTHFIALL